MAASPVTQPTWLSDILISGPLSSWLSPGVTGPRAARPASVHAHWPLLPEPRWCVEGSCRCRVPRSHWGQARPPRRLPDWGTGRAPLHLSPPLLCPAGNGQFRLPGHGGESWRPAVRTGRLGPLGSQAPCHLGVRSCFHVRGLRATSPAGPAAAAGAGGAVSTPIDLLKHGLRGTSAPGWRQGTKCPGSRRPGVGWWETWAGLEGVPWPLTKACGRSLAVL